MSGNNSLIINRPYFCGVLFIIDLFFVDSNMNVYVRKNTSYYYPIIYVIKIIEKNRNIKFTLIDSVENAKIEINFFFND